MARKNLEGRANWQGKAVARGQSAEDIFSVIMDMHLAGSNIEAVHKPRDLKGLYGYQPSGNRKHGIEPEFMLKNRDNNKKIYVEMKRQRAGGNAHERACKYFMPGMVKSIQADANQPSDVYPVWVIFSNGIANSPRYQQEIMHWFKGLEHHVFLWKSLRDHKAIIKHFDSYIRPLLD